MTGIETALKVLFADDQVVELRIIGKRRGDKGSGGYYLNRAKLIETANMMDKKNDHEGIYVVMNRIKKACHARSPDEFKSSSQDPVLTSKPDIERRVWLLVDLDPNRPTGISSSDGEKAMALELAKGVIEYLSNLGWPKPVLADSGNGYHALYRIDLPNGKEEEGLVRDVLDALDQLFTTEAVKVDTQNVDANRLVKLYGTMNRKGAGTDDRPHRRSEIVEVPEEIKTVTREQLEAVANLYEEPETSTKDIDFEKTNIPDWLEEHGLGIYKEKRGDLGTIWVLDRCPWCSSHTDKTAWILQTSNGAVKAGCKHDGCKGKGFKDLWHLFEEPGKNRLERNSKRLEQDQSNRKQRRVQRQKDENVVSKPANKVVTEEELAAYGIDYNPKLTLNLPDTNFLMKFLKYGNGCADAHDELWIAGGLTILSIIANRNLILRTKQGIFKTNLWCQCLGISSATRKSTVINKVDLILATTGLTNNLPDDMSPEAMIEILSNDSRSYLLADESAGIMEALKKDYQKGMKDILMKMYDGKRFERKLKTRANKKTTFIVDEPYLTMLMATTPSRYAASTEEEDLLSGWFQRFIYFYPNAPKTRWMPITEETEDDVEAESDCVASVLYLKELLFDRQDKFRMHFSPEAIEYYANWSHARETEAERKNNDVLSATLSRLTIYAIKLAMLFELGDVQRGDDLHETISEEYMIEACRLVDEYFIKVALMVEKSVGKAADKNTIDRVVAFLTTMGGKATRRDVMRKMHVKMKEMAETEEALVAADEVRLVDLKATNGKTVTWIVLLRDFVTSTETLSKGVDKMKKQIVKDWELPKGVECDSSPSTIYDKNNNNIHICNSTQDRSVTVSRASHTREAHVNAYIESSCDAVTESQPIAVKNTVTKNKTDKQKSKNEAVTKSSVTNVTEYRKNQEKLLKQQAKERKTEKRYCNLCKDPIVGMSAELTGMGEVCMNCFEKQKGINECHKRTPKSKKCAICHEGDVNNLTISGVGKVCYSCFQSYKPTSEAKKKPKQKKVEKNRSLTERL